MRVEESLGSKWTEPHSAIKSTFVLGDCSLTLKKHGGAHVHY